MQARAHGKASAGGWPGSLVRWLGLASLGLLALAPSERTATDFEGLRCDGRLVGLGEHRYVVRARCGEPTDASERSRFVVSHDRYVLLERSYRLGHRFRVRYADAGAYRHALVRYRSGLHDHDLLVSERTELPGGGTLDVTRYWDPGRGPFVWRCSFEEEHLTEWVYDRGPTEFIHILTFRNGRLVRVETGGYGF